MAKIKVTAGSNTDVVVGGGGGALVEPGTYFAAIAAVERKEYKRNDGVKMLKDVVTFNLYAEGSPSIVWDFTIGEVDDKGRLYRADGDNTKSVIWGSTRQVKREDGGIVQTVSGVAAFIVALNMSVDDYDDEAIIGRVVKVTVGHVPFRSNGAERFKNGIVSVNQVLSIDADVPEDVYFSARETESELAWIDEQAFNDSLSGNSEPTI